ncbi:MAG: OmpA family protein [Flavobacteriales bacterium]|nr:OmpA family protein [Flavobacteriales bacterium]
MNKSRISTLFLLLGVSFISLGQDSDAPSNLGSSINSKYNEIGPLISPDGKSMYFVREGHPNNTTDKAESQDIWFSEMGPDSAWTPAKHMLPPFNNHIYNSIETITPSGSMVIVRGIYKNGEFKKGTGFSVTRKTKYAWSPLSLMKIRGLGPMSQGMYYGGFLSNDCKSLLIYLSTYQGSETSDLYVSFIKEDGSWTKPRTLGKKINSPQYDESTPFLASDGITMYYSSNKPKGYGQNDIYMTKRLDETWQNWTEPINLGPTINTEKFEAYYSIDARGEYAYMISEKGSMGRGDVVKVKLPKEVKPEPVVLVRGKILNAKTMRAINGKISYETLGPEGKEVGEALSNPATGEYQITLPYGDLYGFSAKVQGYMPMSDFIDLKEKGVYQEITRDLLLKPIEVGQKVELNNIFFESGKEALKEESFPELDRIISVMNTNPTMTIELIGHTDSIGSDVANQKLSEARCALVRNYIIEHEIQTGRVIATGKGETEPITSNKTEAGRTRNRRVEFEVLTK